jgi:hypothetical protein
MNSKINVIKNYMFKEEPVRIIMLGAAKTKKNFLCQKQTEYISEDKLDNTSTKISKFFMNIDSERIFEECEYLTYQQVEIYDAPCTYYCEIINKIKNIVNERNFNTSEKISDIALEKELVSLKREAVDNINDYVSQLSWENKIGTDFDFVILNFDCCFLWTIDEVEL